MSNRILIYFLLLAFLGQSHVFGQSKKFNNKMECYLDDKGIKYYEGDSEFSLRVIAENTTNHNLNVGRYELVSQVLSILDSSGKNINLKPIRNYFEEINQMREMDTDKSQMRNILPGEKKAYPVDITAEQIRQNANLNQYLDQGDKKISERYATVLKAGTYKVNIFTQYWPLPDTLYHTYTLVVHTAREKVLANLKQYAKALSIMTGQENIAYAVADTLPTLMKMVKENPHSEYLGDAVEILLRKNCSSFDKKPVAPIEYFRQDTIALFQLINMLPTLELKKSPSETWYYRSIFWYSSILFSGNIIKDKKVYIDSYLKKMENKDPKISETIIKDFDNSHRIRGFRNYAQERVDREAPQKIKK